MAKDASGVDEVTLNHGTYFHTTAAYGAVQTAAQIMATASSYYITDIMVTGNTAGSFAVLEETTSAVNKALFKFGAEGGAAHHAFRSAIQISAGANVGVTTDVTITSIILSGYIK